MRNFVIAMVAILVLALQVTAEAGPFGRRGGCSAGGCGTGGCNVGGGGCNVGSGGCNISSSQGCNISSQPRVNPASAADLLQQSSTPVKTVDPAIEAEARTRAKQAEIQTAERRKHTLPHAFAWSQPVSPQVDGKVGKQLYAAK